jgi:hypothetical protein
MTNHNAQQKAKNARHAANLAISKELVGRLTAGASQQGARGKKRAGKIAASRRTRLISF